MDAPRFRIALWLVNTLMNYERLDMAELNELWIKEEDMSHGEPLLRSQMRHAIEAALDSLGVVIECDRRKGYKYFIAANNGIKATEWLISSHAINKVLSESNEIRERILLEEIPSGQYHLSTIVEAMTKGKALEMDYQKFSDSEPYTCFIEPYCVKLSQQRWYVLARKDHRDHLQVFALDRIKQLRILHDASFLIDPEFNGKDYFHDFFGVYAGSGLIPEQVRIRVYGIFRNYFRTLPIHSSQREILSPKIKIQDSTEFEYLVATTPDFINQLLSYGANIEVLEPESLRQKMKTEAQKMTQRYE